MQTTQFRIQVEGYLITLLSKSLLDAGYRLVVNDGEEDTRCASVQEVLEAATAVDEATLQARKGDEKFWFYFVFGNDGYDVMADCTTNAEQFLEYCGYEKASDTLDLLINIHSCDTSAAGHPTVDGTLYPDMQSLLDTIYASANHK